MEFSWSAAAITVLVVLIEAGFSFSEGTFSRKQYAQINLSFLWHWGVSIGDLFILPIVNGLVVPHLFFAWWYVLLAIVSAAITDLCHKSWWPEKDTKLAQGFIIRSSRISFCLTWRNDITQAGTIHYLFMVFQLIILGGYIFTPMPLLVVKLVSLLFIPFVLVAIVEPGIIQTGGWRMVSRKDWIMTVGTTALTYGLIVLTWFFKAR